MGSYLEIYNEQVRDLLSSTSGVNLKAREHPSTGPYVEGTPPGTHLACAQTRTHAQTQHVSPASISRCVVYLVH